MKPFTRSLVFLPLLGCGAVHFHDAPIVWRVEDDDHIAEPEERLYNRFTHYLDSFLTGRVERALTLPDDEQARDLNAIDEVPDSAWFENRIGRYALTPDDVATGPGGAEPKLPFTITKGKADGSNPGFVVKDADGRKFVIKLDPAVQPDMQTANAAIASRLFWAAGYHTPTENVMTVHRSQMLLDPKATYDKGLEEDLPFDDEYLDKILELTIPPENGAYRVLASEFLPGKPKGGWPMVGVRTDDNNDRFAHEHRRTLRALQVFCAWLDHTDINPQNTLSMYQTHGGRSFLKHYLIDFGETLGAHGLEHPWMSYSHFIDPHFIGLSLLALGFWERPWEDEPGRPFPTVGLYFPQMDPTAWREAKPYFPFMERTAADTFWAAKIIMSFERAHVEAAVAKGKMRDPAAAGYMADTIYARRLGIGYAYMTKVTALDRFDARKPDRLCMTDLAVMHHLADGGFVERLEDGDVVEKVPIGADGQVCVKGPGDAAYSSYELRTVRGDDRLESIEVHVKGGSAPALLGVRRF